MLIKVSMFLLFMLVSVAAFCQEMSGTIYFYRIKALSGNNAAFEILHNDARVGYSIPATYIPYKCAAGPQRFRITSNGKEETVTVQIKPGKIYFVRCLAAYQSAIPQMTEVLLPVAKRDLNHFASKSGTMLADSLVKLAFRMGAQRFVGEISLFSTNIENLKAKSIGDSIFISFEENGTFSSEHSAQQNAFGLERSMWLLKDGTINESKDPLVSQTVLSGISNGGKWLYYFAGDKSKITIKSTVANNSTGEKEILPREIEIPGKILGSYEDHGLHVIWVEKKGYTLKVTHIRNMEVISEKNYPLSVKLFKNNSEHVTFINAGRHLRPEEASAKLKIIRSGEELWIIVDDAHLNNFEEGKVYSSTVTHVDINSGEVKSRSFFEQALTDLCTTVIDHYVFWMISGREIQVYDFDTGKLIKKIPLTQDPGDMMVYSRIGTKYKVEKELSKPFFSKANFLSVEHTDSDSLEIAIGLHYMEKPNVIIPIPGSIVLTALLRALIQDLSEGNHASSYSYFRTTLEGTLKPSDRIGTVRRSIDEYEYNLTSIGTKFTYKGYLNTGATVFGFYIEKNSEKLRVIAFDE